MASQTVDYWAHISQPFRDQLEGNEPAIVPARLHAAPTLDPHQNAGEAEHRRAAVSWIPAEVRDGDPYLLARRVFITQNDYVGYLVLGQGGQGTVSLYKRAEAVHPNIHVVSCASLNSLP